MSVYIITAPVIVLRSCLVIADSKEDAMQSISREGAKATFVGLHKDETYDFFLQDGALSVSVQQLDTARPLIDQGPPSGTVIQ